MPPVTVSYFGVKRFTMSRASVGHESDLKITIILVIRKIAENFCIGTFEDIEVEELIV